MTQDSVVTGNSEEKSEASVLKVISAIDVQMTRDAGGRRESEREEQKQNDLNNLVLLKWC